MGVELKILSESTVDPSVTCAKAHLCSIPSNSDKEGENLTRADSKANPMVANKPLRVQKINPSRKENDPKHNRSNQAESIKPPGAASRNSSHHQQVVESPDEGSGDITILELKPG